MSESERTYDVIIVGSGVGGLTAGLTLQTLKPEMKTLILEQHNAPGGFISGFKRKGFYFDSGAEGMVMCGENQNFRKAINGLGVNLDLLNVDPLEVLHFPDKTVTMYANPEKYTNELIQKYPEDEEGIKGLFEVLKNINKEYNSTVKNDLNPSFKEYLKIIFTCPNMRKYAFMSFKALIDKFITNEQLKKVLKVYCLWLGIPSESIRAVSAAITFFSPIFDGYYYPKGGMFSFAESLADSYVNRGGEIEYKKKVSKILTKRRKAIGIELVDGTKIKGRWIISNADLKKTVFEHVGMKKFPNRYLTKIAKMNQSVSGFSVFLGLDKELTDSHSHLVYNLDPDEYIKEILAGEYDPKEVLIRIPSKIDPALKNNGKSSLILLSFAPYKFKNKWNSSERESYAKTKEEYADKLIKLAENIIPNLSKHIELKLVSTPLTFERFTLNSQGAWYGPRSDSKQIGKKTPIRRLFLAGANAVGGGVPPSFFSGINTAKHIMNRFSAGKRTLRILFPVISHLSFRARNRAVLSIA